MAYVFPTSGPVAWGGSQFGAQRGGSGRHHAGVDFRAANGSQAVAVIGGKVIHVGYDKGGYDHYAIIQGDDGNMYRYATHGPITAKVGQHVGQGEPVGTIDRRHLHFEVATPSDAGWKSLKAGGNTQWWGKNKPITTDPMKFFGVPPGTVGVAGLPFARGGVASGVPPQTIPAYAGTPPRTPAQQEAAALATGQPAQTLRKGMSDRSTGGAVSRLQQQLTDAGFNPGPVDGSYGSQTEKAVRAFERSAGLQVERPGRGAAGPEVLGRLPATAATRAATTARAIAGGASAFDPNTPAARPVDVVSARTLPWDVKAGPDFSIANAGPPGQRLQAGTGVVTLPDYATRPSGGPPPHPQGAPGMPGPYPGALAGGIGGGPPISYPVKQGLAPINVADYLPRSAVSPDPNTFALARRSQERQGAALNPREAARAALAPTFPAARPDMGVTGFPRDWTKAPMQDVTAAGIPEQLSIKEGNAIDLIKRGMVTGRYEPGPAAYGITPPGVPAWARGVTGAPSPALAAAGVGTGGITAAKATPLPPQRDIFRPAVPAPTGDQVPENIGGRYVPHPYSAPRPGQQSYYTPPSGGLDAYPQMAALGGGALIRTAPEHVTPYQDYIDRDLTDRSWSSEQRPQMYPPRTGGQGGFSSDLQSAETRFPSYDRLGGQEASLTPIVHVPSGDGIGRPYSKSNFASRFDTPVGALPGAKIATGAAPLTEHGAGYTVFDPQAADTTGVKWDRTLGPSAFDPAAVSPPVRKVVNSLAQAPAANKLQVAAQVLKAIGQPGAGLSAPGSTSSGPSGASPWTTRSYIANYLSSQGVTPGHYIGSTPSGYTSPNYNPVSGGSIYAYKRNDSGGGTYVDSQGRTHSY